MTKIRIMSDLHYSHGLNGPDYDKTYKGSGLYHYFGKKFEEVDDCVNLIAGDICEGVNNHKEFLESFFPHTKTIFIDGNHLVYEEGHPVLSSLKQGLKDMFPKDHLLYNYLENDWIWIPQTDVAVIGSTFYTDYSYCDLTLDELNEKVKAWNAWMNCYGLDVDPDNGYKKLTKSIIRKEAMIAATSYLNDFRWGNENKLTRLSPEYYLKLHKLAKKEIKRCHDEILSINSDAKIILMTHHCLSPKCILDKYKKSLINASYVSDLEKWVDKELTGVKLVVSGHVHNRCDFNFGKRNVRYILNPCGYIRPNEPFETPKFNPNLIIDTNEL